jgi:hypothetical protein
MLLCVCHCLYFFLLQEASSESEPLIRLDGPRGKGRGRGSPPLDHDRVRVGHGRGGQSDKGDNIVTSRAVRSTRSRESESEQFSWDPNSKKRGSRASSKSKRDPSRDNSRAGSVSHSPKTSPQFVSHTTRPSPGPGGHNRLSPGSSGGGGGGGGHHLQEWRGGSSVARSASLEFGNNGELATSAFHFVQEREGR